MHEGEQQLYNPEVIQSLLEASREIYNADAERFVRMNTAIEKWLIYPQILKDYLSYVEMGKESDRLLGNLRGMEVNRLRELTDRRLALDLKYKPNPKLDGPNSFRQVRHSFWLALYSADKDGRVTRYVLSSHPDELPSEQVTSISLAEAP